MIKSKATLAHLAPHLTPSSRIIMRVDYNVPVKDDKILDLARVKATLPTIQHLLKSTPKSLVLLSHMGRPDGAVNPIYSTKKLIDPLSSLIGKEVKFIDYPAKAQDLKKIDNSQNEIFLCQNVRFNIEQLGFRTQSNIVDDKKILHKVHANPHQIFDYQKKLSKMGDIFVNDAFGASHRPHSSIIGIKHKFKVAGLLMQKQLQELHNFKTKAQGPKLVILGGAKVLDKFPLINKMIDHADEIIIGGGMSFPFLREIQKLQLGSTIVKMPNNLDKIHNIIKKAQKKGVKIHFPVDATCAQQLNQTAQTKIFQNQDIPQGWRIYDNGPKTNELFADVISRANSIFWNGPVGVFQNPSFLKGSESLMKSVVERTKKGATSIIGGGDTANLAKQLGVQQQVTYVSTGGGATLSYMQGNSLPGVTALSDIKVME